MSKLHGIITYCPVANTSKGLPENRNFSHSALFHLKTWVFLKYFVRGCSSSQVFSNVYTLIHLIFERWFDKMYNIVTADLSVPKLHKTSENVKASYYFDMIRQGVLHLYTLYTTLLEPKFFNLTFRYID